jgi:hypothetical protein
LGNRHVQLIALCVGRCLRKPLAIEAGARLASSAVQMRRRCSGLASLNKCGCYEAVTRTIDTVHGIDSLRSSRDRKGLDEGPDWNGLRLSLDNLSTNNAAGQALVRILRLALPDEGACKRALQEALRSANRAELPSDGEELLRLVRAHLAPALSKDVPPNLVFALIDDLKAEIEQHRGGKDPTSSSRMRAATSFPPAPDTAAAVLDLASRGEAQAEAPFPKLRASVSNLRRVSASTSMRAGPAAASAPAPAVPSRPSVVVVESDRMTRAGLARTLVGARFDVSVLENVVELHEWMRDRSERVVVVVDVMGEGTAAALHGLAAEHPSMSVVAWTDASPADVEGALASIGPARVGIAPKAAGGAQVVDRVRALCGPA